MTARLEISGSEWATVNAHLLGSSVEEAAYILAEVRREHDAVVFSHVETECFLKDDFAHQSAYHIELTDEARGRMIKAAWDAELSLVELHSHVSRDYPAAFSPSDVTGFEEFVPHVWWRLRGRPYAAIVVAPTGFDAVAWVAGADAPMSLTAIIAEGVELKPAGLSLRRRGAIRVR